MQLGHTPRTPSSLVDGFDPTGEDVILHFLAKDPTRRPASALAVAAALPGGNLLEEALAAGETPSPQLVADAGAAGGLGRATALACLVGIVVGVVFVVLGARQTQLSAMAPLERPPAVLQARAEEVLRNLGYAQPPRDAVGGFTYDARYIAWLAQRDRSPSRWDRLATDEPNPILFWYRQSPRPLISPSAEPRPSYFSPASTLPGMVAVMLDPRGRLRRLDAVPTELEDTPAPSGDPDWAVVFREAGLEPSRFIEVRPRWVPPVYADRRAAWQEVDPAPERSPTRLEAAALGGRIVAFRTIEPWTAPVGAQGQNTVPFSTAALTVAIVWFFGAAIVAALVARRNLQLGRGDVRGSLRLALFILFSLLLFWLCLAHHVSGFAEVGFFTVTLANAVFFSCLVWVFYMALEPYLRRLWPQTIVSWVRLLDGRFRDPLVGRDVLLGVLCGVALALGPRLYHLAPIWLGRPPARPDILGWSFLEFHALIGLRQTAAVLLYFTLGGLFVSLIVVVGVLLLRLLLRKQWPAISVAFFLLTVLFNPAAGNIFVDWLVAGAGVALLFFVLFRIGLLAAAVCIAIAGMLLGVPLTFDLATWQAGGSLLALAVVVAVTLYGFFTSLAGRPLLAPDLLHEGA
jgi:serine/threonine-protein kinase